ncbi:hypothetical protein [Oryza sativa Japonica Group]|uniref:Uncharacterized protein n=1 Tax=Oryza sativa subsp. japonica TaxID=39947 RepID=Q5ZCP8_ORYSJ|nr:hypothetical protein [Oryza sativa Japonica Group]
MPLPPPLLPSASPAAASRIPSVPPRKPPPAAPPPIQAAVPAARQARRPPPAAQCCCSFVENEGIRLSRVREEKRNRERSLCEREKRISYSCQCVSTPRPWYNLSCKATIQINTATYYVTSIDYDDELTRSSRLWMPPCRMMIQTAAAALFLALITILTFITGLCIRGKLRPISLV